MSETLPAYAITNYTDLLNSSRCRSDIDTFRDGVDRGLIWSMRMLDASGQAFAGFVGGNNFWLGDRKSCIYLSENYTLALSKERKRNISIYRDPSEEQPPYELHFFIAQILHYSTLQYHLGLPQEDHIMLGLCLPASCTKNDVSTILSKVLSDGNLLVGQMFSTDLQLISVSDLVDDHQWLRQGIVVVAMIILLLLCGIIIVSTAYDLIVIQNRIKSNSLSCENNNTTGLKNDAEEKHEHDPVEFTLSELKPRNSYEKYIECFSFYTNLQQVFNGKTGTDSILLFHSLKFLGMVWICLVHSIYYGRLFVANKISSVQMSTGFFMQIIANGTYSVDTFFFIGGFLLTYVFLQAIGKETKPKSLKSRMYDLLLGIVKRYIRLTPAYLVVILLSILNFNWYDKVSLYAMSENESSLCTKYWWRNLLYIHNFYEFDNMCLSWSWYLSNDMQFFIFGSFLLILSTKYQNVAVGLGATAFFASILSAGYVTYDMDFVPMLDKQMESLTYIYIRPWTRIAPYLVGMATAVYLIKRNCKLHLSKKVLLAGWMLAILCNCSVLFGLVERDISLFLSVLYTSLTRAAWSIGIAWLVIVCCTNHGGIVNKFLSLALWVPLGRLTYAAYLINPFIIISIYRSSNYTWYIDILSIGSMFLGVLVATYCSAIVISTASEVPFIRILRVITRQNRGK